MAPAKIPKKKAQQNVPTSQHGQQPDGRPSPRDVETEDQAPWAQPGDTYALAQEDELEVLKAIYMEDFEEVEAKGAWSVSILSEHSIVHHPAGIQPVTPIKE